jgi:Tfp pilus assembly protein PilF
MFRVGRWWRRRANATQARKLLPLTIPARETRGFIFLKLGDSAIAATEYEKALQLDANSPLDDAITPGQRRALLQHQLAQLLGTLGQVIGSKQTAF